MKFLIKAAAALKNNKRFVFVLVGAGSQKEELMQMVKKNKLSNCLFLPPIPKTSIPALLNKFDILYAGGTHSILHSYGTSYNKITDYMLAEKPIIFAVDEPDSLIEKVGCGIQIPAENETDIVKTILYLGNLSLKERNEMGEKGRNYAIKNLDYKVLATKYLEILKV